MDEAGFAQAVQHLRRHRTWRLLRREHRRGRLRPAVAGQPFCSVSTCSTQSLWPTCCVFVGPAGCTLRAKPSICWNYNCRRIHATVPSLRHRTGRATRGSCAATDSHSRGARPDQPGPRHHAARPSHLNLHIGKNLNRRDNNEILVPAWMTSEDPNPIPRAQRTWTQDGTTNRRSQTHVFCRKTNRQNRALPHHRLR